MSETGTDLQNFNLTPNFFSSHSGIHIPTLDEFDSYLFTPALAVDTQLDLAKLTLSERLKENVGSKVDFLARQGMRSVQRRIGASGGEGSNLIHRGKDRH